MALLHYFLDITYMVIELKTSTKSEAAASVGKCYQKESAKNI